jgi:hypothetical protein
MSSYVRIVTDSVLVELDDRSPNEKRMKPVIQLDKEGNEIARYASIAEAERITKIRHIYECVNHKPSRKTAGGYIWRLAEGE